MPKAANTPTTPRRPDHELRILGEAWHEANRRRGGDDLDEIERDRLTARWFETIDAMCGVEAKTPAGLRIKASAIIIYFARIRGIHKVALSLAGDILAGPSRRETTA